MENITPDFFKNKSTISLQDSKWKIYKDMNEKSKKKNNNENIDNIKLSIYSKINQNSSQLALLLEKNKNLKKENTYLRQAIKNKDKLILEFSLLFQQFKEKFIKVEKINQILKNKLNKYKNDINIKTNDCQDYKNIKEDLIRIENDYNNKIKEKDKMIEKMNEELIYIYNEYKNLSNIIEKVNNYIYNSNYIELKNKINDLTREKDLLIKQNEKREKRIISLIKKNENINESNMENNENMIVTFKNQDNEYVKTINLLQNRIVEKDKEIQMIKEEFKKIIKE